MTDSPRSGGRGDLSAANDYPANLYDDAVDVPDEAVTAEVERWEREQRDAAYVRSGFGPDDEPAWEVVTGEGDSARLWARFSRRERNNAVDFANGFNLGYSRASVAAGKSLLRRIVRG